MSTYRRILKYLTTHPWAIDQDHLDAIVEILDLRAQGDRLGMEEIAARVAAARTRQGSRSGGGVVGVVPIYGAIMPHANVMTEMSGGTTVDGIRQAFRRAMADEEVTRIVFDVDSPGGSVEGIPELAAEIRNARGVKPMTSVANYLMASAAYYLAVQADEVVASPSALVGSVGVYGVHTDISAANEKLGIKRTYIYAGQFKTEGIPDAPLSEDARAHLQSLVDASYDLFVRDVAAARGISQKAVLERFGQGRAFDPIAAEQRGMVDRIASLDEVLASKPPRMRARRQEGVAEVEDVERVATAEPEPTTEDPAFAFERERRARLRVRPA